MPLHFSVPCGHCEECRDMMRSEWYIRAFYHWESVKSIGGCAFFYTLTYREDSLPHYNDVRCFDKISVQKFCKRLKERMWRKYKIHLDFLITCEYGELFKRPHYHAIFFLDRQILPWSFYNQVNESWSLGFVYAGRYGGIVNSPSGILYVTKYVCKDSSFINLDSQLYATIKKDYSEMYESWYHGIGDELFAPESFDALCKEHLRWSNIPEVAEWYNAFKREYSRHSTFNLHSSKLGYALIDAKNRLNLNKDTVLIPQGSGYIEMPLPRYIIRYLYYDRVPNERDGKRTKFVLNVDGMKHQLDTIDYRIDKLALDYQNFFSSTRLTDYQFTQLRSQFNFIGNKDLRFFLDNLSCNYRNMAIYSLVYRNRFSIGQDYEFFNEYKDYMSNLFSVLEDKNDVPLSEYTSKQINHINDNLFNYHPIFAPYELLYQLYVAMAEIIRKERAYNKQQKVSNERQLRDYLKLSNLSIAV